MKSNIAIFFILFLNILLFLYKENNFFYSDILSTNPEYLQKSAFFYVSYFKFKILVFILSTVFIMRANFKWIKNKNLNSFLVINLIFLILMNSVGILIFYKLPLFYMEIFNEKQNNLFIRILLNLILDTGYFMTGFVSVLTSSYITYVVAKALDRLSRYLLTGSLLFGCSYFFYTVFFFQRNLDILDNAFAIDFILINTAISCVICNNIYRFKSVDS